jgi:hypothetical protein
MAFNIVAQPDQYHPGYNPVVYGANDSNDYRFPGYRYIFSFYEDGETTPFQILKAAPNPVNGDGIVDVSKALQSFISYDLDFNELEPFEARRSHFIYDVKIGLEYIVNWSFTGFTNDAGYVKLVNITPSFYSFGDYITVMIDPSITDDRKALNGTFKIKDIYANYIVINLLYAELGGGASIGGITYATNGELISINDIETITDRIVYNEAVPFKEWNTWTENKILPDLSGYPEGDILTNSPNWLVTAQDKDKYIIKTYQELYWNTMNNPVGDDSTTLANTMIVENEFGDRWMLANYDDWDDTTIKMRQFNVSPDNQNWINITPNWGTGTFYQTGFNPYTHINSDSSLSVSKWLDYWPTYAPGYDECDAIDMEIIQDPSVPGPPTTTFNYTFRPVGTGRNQRRVYQTLIDGKYSFLTQDIDPGNQRVWNWYMSDNPWPSLDIVQYSVFAKRTSNNLPYGTTNASNNSADAWKAFDGNPNTFWQTTGSPSSATLTYNLPYTSGLGWARPHSYTIDKGFPTTNAPMDWTFQGSRDGGSTWVTLHTVVGSTTGGEYTSPNLFILQAYTRFRINVTRVVSGTNIRINNFKLNGLSRIARMVSGNDCPISGGFLFWNLQGFPIPEYTSVSLGTTAVLPVVYNEETDEMSTIPTLQKRRVYLDYTCQDNQTQILFLDRAGSWSSFSFPLKVNERMDNEKLDYRTNIGFVESGQWTYNTYDAEIKTYHSNVKKQYNLTTNFLNEGMDTYFQELISSPVTYVKLKDSNVWLSCNVLTKSLEPITRRLKQRTITIELNSQDNINI